MIFQILSNRKNQENQSNQSNQCSIPTFVTQNFQPMPKPTKPKKEKPKVNPKLEGLDIYVNEFGQVVKDFDLNQVNKFLTETVKDKKFENEG